MPCGKCRQCQMGASQRCERRMGYGLYLTTDVAPGLWGGYATHLYLHPDAQMEKAPTHIPSDVMTLFNPLSGVVHWIYEIPKLRMAEHVRHSRARSARHSGGADRTARRRQDGHGLGTAAGSLSPCTGERTRRRCHRRRQHGGHRRAGARRHRRRDGRRRARHVGRLDRADPAGARRRPDGRSGRAGGAQERQVGQRARSRTRSSSRDCRCWAGSARPRAHSISRSRSCALTTAGCGPICSHSFALDQADLAVRTLGREVDDGREVVHVSLVMRPK